MSLTQTQLEEAMEPAKFERAGPLESDNALSPTITTENAYTSSASPVNSLLAGEKIQFGKHIMFVLYTSLALYNAFSCLIDSEIITMPRCSYLANCTGSDHPDNFNWAWCSRFI
jgi:hypothetical protein